MVHFISNQKTIECCFEQATIKDVVEYCHDKTILGLDIETTVMYPYKDAGLDPYTSKIVMLQIGDEENQFVIDTRTVNISDLIPILENPEITFVGHNLKFEYKHLLHNYGIKLENIYDTMIVEQVLNNGYISKRYGLKDLVEHYLSIEIEKGTRLEFLSIGSKPFTTEQIEYGAMDIVYPLQIKDLQQENIELLELSKCIQLEMEFLKVLGDIEYQGINFNKDKWLETYKENQAEYVKYLNELNSFVITNHFDTDFVSKQLSLFDEGVTCAIEWSSSKQVINFFKHLGFCPRSDKKKSGYTVEAMELKKLFNDKSFQYASLVKTYLKCKEFEQAVTTFGKDFFKYVNPITQRIHTDYKQILNTGRISSRNPNMQNIPRRKEFRKAFDAPEGWVIINADYSGQESIVLANKSKDPGMMEFYLTGGGDLHSYAATKMYRIIDNDPTLIVTKESYPDKRQNAKALNFKLAYGGSAYTVKDDLGGISEQEAQKFIDIYFEAFPGLLDYFDSCKKFAVKHGYVIIDEITNRRWWFSSFSDMNQAKQDERWSDYFKLKGSLERNSLNYPIQGTSGSITKLAAVKFRAKLIERKLTNDAFISNIIHDEINVECTEESSYFVSKLLEQSMVEAGQVWCKTVPLSAEAVISDYWTH